MSLSAFLRNFYYVTNKYFLKIANITVGMIEAYATSLKNITELIKNKEHII